MFIQDLSEGAITDPAVLEIAGRVRVTPTYDLPNKKALAPVEVDLHLADGRVLTRRVEYARGHPRLPMSRDELVDKFYRTAEAAGSERIAANASRIVELVSNLDDLRDARELGRLLG
jgi:2-methylcitrate dehydratase PrpD